MIACPNCALQLPDYARFCARCGTRLPLKRRLAAGTATWVLVLLALGAAGGALFAVVYSVIALTPQLPPTDLDPQQVRASAVALAVLGAAICVIQVAALIGLSTGRDWGRVLATIACVAWSLTCVGLPLSLAMISSLWSRKNPTT